MTRKFEKSENEKWLDEIHNQFDLNVLDKDQVGLQIGIGTILNLITEKLNMTNKQIFEIRNLMYDDNDDKLRMQLKDLLLYESILIESHSRMDAIIRGAKHPIQRYIDSARTVYGGNRLNFREIRLRGLCVGFMEHYQNCFNSSVLKSANIVVDTLNGYVPRNFTVPMVKNYFDDRNALGIFADQQVTLAKDMFKQLYEKNPDHLFLELRFFVASSIGADAVRRLFEMSNRSYELLKSPPLPISHKVVN